jgi:oxygen-independent coproporphyrinogen-3 oxidase
MTVLSLSPKATGQKHPDATLDSGSLLRPLGVYVHVPFCRVHCPYCDFITYPSSRLRDLQYIEGLTTEISLLDQRLNRAQHRISTVYFGGGTPSTLGPSQVEHVLRVLGAAFEVAGNLEVSMEANPEDVDESALAEFESAGINRFSIGIQTFDTAQLEHLGRLHTAEHCHKALSALSTRSNWSADLMFGWEDHTGQVLKDDLDTLLQYEPDHVSLYQLTLEPRTRFGVLAAMGTIRTAPNDRQAELYLFACEYLAKAGLAQYEVSNFARPDKICRHNQGYWDRTPYIGLGPSAASLLNERRTRNLPLLPRYLRRLETGVSPVHFVEVLTPETVRAERIWLGLRSKRGIPRIWLHDAALNVVQRAYEQGYVSTANDSHIFLCPKGMAVADELVARILRTE